MSDEKVNDAPQYVDPNVLGARVETFRRQRDAEIQRVRDLDDEVQLMRRELVLAYDVIDGLPESALDGIKEAKLLAVVRAMEDAEKRADLTTAFDRLVAENAELERRLKLAEAALESVKDIADADVGEAELVIDPAAFRAWKATQGKPDADLS